MDLQLLYSNIIKWCVLGVLITPNIQESTWTIRSTARGALAPIEPWSQLRQVNLITDIVKAVSVIPHINSSKFLKCLKSLADGDTNGSSYTMLPLKVKGMFQQMLICLCFFCVDEVKPHNFKSILALCQRLNLL